MGRSGPLSIRSIERTMVLWKLWMLRQARVAPVGATLASELIARAAAIGAGKPRRRRHSAPSTRPACRAPCLRGAGAAPGRRLGPGRRARLPRRRGRRGRRRAQVRAGRGAGRGDGRGRASSGCRPRLRPSPSSGVRWRARSSPSFRRPSRPSSPSRCSSSSHPQRPARSGSSTPGSTTCLVSHGKAPRSRRLREVARAALDGVIVGSAQVHARVVERWDQAVRRARRAGTRRGVGAARRVPRRGRDRARPDPRARLALRPASAARARPRRCRRAASPAPRLRPPRRAAAGDRRARRRAADCVGPDLGGRPRRLPAARARALQRRPRPARRARREPARDRALDPLDDAPSPARSRTRSRPSFARSRARPASRRSSRSTASLADLSDSQKIVLFRVVQEALSNVRKHSGADERLGRAAQHAHLRRPHRGRRRLRLRSARGSARTGSASPASPSACGCSAAPSRSRRAPAQARPSGRRCRGGGRRHRRPRRVRRDYLSRQSHRLSRRAVADLVARPSCAQSRCADRSWPADRHDGTTTRRPPRRGRRSRRSQSSPASRRPARCSSTPSPSRKSPNPHARVIKVMHQFRPDFRPQEVLAVGDADRLGRQAPGTGSASRCARTARTAGFPPSTVTLAPTHEPDRDQPRRAHDRRLPARQARLAREGRHRRARQGDAARPLLRRGALRPVPRPVPRRLRRRDERLLEADRVAGRRRRRHPRHEPAAAARPGRLARLRARLERDGRGSSRRSRRSARRSRSRSKLRVSERNWKAGRPSAARKAAAPRGAPDCGRRALDRVAARRAVPAAARRVGDRDLAEAVEEGVAGAAGAAVPALGGRDRRSSGRGSGAGRSPARRPCGSPRRATSSGGCASRARSPWPASRPEGRRRPGGRSGSGRAARPRSRCRCRSRLGKPLKPTWSHSFVPSGPWPGPPTPTQPATWPLRMSNASRGVISAEIP